MRPVHHEANLAAFFRRHDLPAPYSRPDGAMERFGLVLAMAFALRAAGFRVLKHTDGAITIGARRFSAAEVHEAWPDAYRTAHLFEDIHDGRHPDPSGTCVDRMALIAIRLAAAEIAVTPDTLLGEGIPFGVVAEYGLDAAQLAEAMKLAVNLWQASAKRRTAELAEAA